MFQRQTMRSLAFDWALEILSIGTVPLRQRLNRVASLPQPAHAHAVSNHRPTKTNRPAVAMETHPMERFTDSLLPDLAVLQSFVNRESDRREFVKKPAMERI
jgi:hypothetical protein